MSFRFTHESHAASASTPSSIAISDGVFQRSSGGFTTSWPGASTAIPAPEVGVATMRTGT